MPMSSYSSPLPIPVSLFISSSIMPEASLAVSLTTPRGSGDTKQLGLRTVPSDGTVTERDVKSTGKTRIARPCRFSHQMPSPSFPVVRSEYQETHQENPTPHCSVHMVDASVGRNVNIVGAATFASPTCSSCFIELATNNASSYNSYLSLAPLLVLRR